MNDNILFLHGKSRRLSDKDCLALQMHVSWIEEHAFDENPSNPIIDNFCHRVGIDMHDLVRIVVRGHWPEVEKKLRARGLIL